MKKFDFTHRNGSGSVRLEDSSSPSDAQDVQVAFDQRKFIFGTPSDGQGTVYRVTKGLTGDAHTSVGTFTLAGTVTGTEPNDVNFNNDEHENSPESDGDAEYDSDGESAG